MLVCPHCKRSNPAEAAFCHFDGVELRAGRDSNVQTDLWLPAPFVFPSGRRCRNLEQLALGCQEEWQTARVLLVQGVFAQFLQTCGRLDLTRAAHKAATQSDPDIALQTFLVGLPLPAEFRPRLELRPRRLLLGSLRVGERRTVQLLVVNAGRGLLHGSLTVHGGGSWLRLADGGERCSLKTTQQQAVALQLDTRGLAAGQTHGACLTIITNGGIVEVPVRLDLAAFGFPTAPFEGAAAAIQACKAVACAVEADAAVIALDGGIEKRLGEQASEMTRVEFLVGDRIAHEHDAVAVPQGDVRGDRIAGPADRSSVALRAQSDFVYPHAVANVVLGDPAHCAHAMARQEQELQCVLSSGQELGLDALAG